MSHPKLTLVVIIEITTRSGNEHSSLCHACSLHWIGERALECPSTMMLICPLQL